ncbi:MAG: valine--tRNA ligase [Phycisphaerae bacterium]|nr:valine--tRNA ligase [Phycisphaerae bacterium]
MSSNASSSRSDPSSADSPRSAAARESSGGLAKSYNPAECEPQVRARWRDARCFHAVPGAGADPARPPFAVLIPPPNVTAALHLGHALNNTLQDVLVRWRRMLGHPTLWMPGTDHAGIATQTVVEKRLLREGIRRQDLGRDRFIARVQEWKDEYEATIIGQLEDLGCSCDFERTRFTMDPVCTAAVRTAFFRLFSEGLIYRGKRLVNWDPVTQTALADDEVEMRTVAGRMHYLKYPLEDGSGVVVVATTRPETMLGDVAVAVNPRDPRAPSLRGKRVRLPIVDRIIPIVEDEFVVMPASLGGDPGDPKASFATGFLKVTPAHDPNDWEIGRRHDLAVVNVLGPDGAISDRHGFADVSPTARAFVGLSREDARVAIVEWFRAKGLLEEVREYEHAVGHSYRSHVPIEPWLSDQWYVRVTDPRLAGAALRAMAGDQVQGSLPAAAQALPATPGDGELRFSPDRYARTFQTWHENLRDWCISRQLWWGHRIPVWSRRGDAASLGIPAAVVARAAGEGTPFRGAWSERGAAEMVRALPDGTFEHLVCVPSPTELGEAKETALAADLAKAGYAQDQDVLDTWFSSALWPLSTMGWPTPARFPETLGLLETFNPSSVLCTAREIITLWVSRMVMFNRHLHGGRLPFRDVLIHAMIQDGHGQKMSKSLGNGFDPRDIVHGHGADALRFTLVQLTTSTQDVRIPVDMVCPHTGETFTPPWTRSPSGHVVAEPVVESPKAKGRFMTSAFGAASGLATPSADRPLARNTSSRFDGGRNFANKLWNATRFAVGILEQAPGEGPAASPSGARLPSGTRLEDRWILAVVRRALARLDASLGEFQFSQVAEVLYDFAWRDFCDWYLEAIKPSVRDDARQRQVLRSVLEVLLRMLHPVCPFVTEALWPHLRATGPGGLRGLPLADSPLVATAAWPAIDASLDDDDAVATFERVRTLVSLVRTLRGERNVPPKKKLRLLVSPSVEALARAAGGLVEHLAGLEVVESLGAGATPPAGAAAIAFEGSEVWLDGLVEAGDLAGERARLEKLIAQRRGQVSGFEAKLSNPGYLAKAKPETVEETRRLHAAAAADLDAAQRALGALGGREPS